MTKLKSAALCAALLQTAPANAQPRHEYWFSGSTQNNNLIEYVDVASITADKSDNRRAWVIDFYSPTAPKYAGLHSTNLEEVNCRTKQLHSLQLTMNDSSGANLSQYSEDEPESWSYAVPGSLGETLVSFICAKSTAERNAIGVKLPPGFTPEKDAKATFEFKPVEDKSTPPTDLISPPSK